jgi:hypothetical protein
MRMCSRAVTEVHNTVAVLAGNKGLREHNGVLEHHSELHRELLVQQVRYCDCMLFETHQEFEVTPMTTSILWQAAQTDEPGLDVPATQVRESTGAEDSA